VKALAIDVSGGIYFISLNLSWDINNLSCNHHYDIWAILIATRKLWDLYHFNLKRLYMHIKIVYPRSLSFRKNDFKLKPLLEKLFLREFDKVVVNGIFLNNFAYISVLL